MSNISNRKPITEVLADTGIAAAYSHFVDGHEYPYLVYIGSGQENLLADNTTVWRGNTYQLEYYYTIKNEEAETAIEDAILAGGWNYSKSSDSYIEDEGVFVIFYDVS